MFSGKVKQTALGLDIGSRSVKAVKLGLVDPDF